MVSNCCGAKSMIGERIDTATYPDHTGVVVTLNMGYCSECGNCSIFVKEEE